MNPMDSAVPAYFVAAVLYGLLGLVVSAVYICCRNLRQEPVVHAVSAVLVGLSTVVAIFAATEELSLSYLPNVHVGTRFFLFVSAGLCYIPVVLFLGLHYFNVLMGGLLDSRGARGQEEREETPKEQIKKVRAYLAILAREPSNTGVRERLGNLYARMGFLDSAVYEYRRTSDGLTRGYAHATTLFKAARILDKKGDLDKAVPILRRLVRLYPKSYFAAYARRVINRYEAQRAAKDRSSQGRNP